MKEKQLICLSRQELGNLPLHLIRPAYDPCGVTPGVLHIGTGNFMMSHLGSYINDLLAVDPSWGIVACSIRSRGTIASLGRQDGLYVLVERENNDRKASVMAPIVDTVYGPEERQKMTAYIADPRIRLVTLTVSNKGYLLGPDGNLDATSPDVVHDLNLSQGETPKSIYWYLTAGLAERMKVGTPLTIMSLDNVPENSRALQCGLLQYVELTRQAELLEWIKSSVDFPVTTVDRITPETTEEFRDSAGEFTGVNSAVVVGCESFRQLVVERSRFELPPWGAVGVQTVEDCAQYWQLKFFVLNTGHQVAAMSGQRLGLKYIHEAAGNPAVARLLVRAHEEFATFLPCSQEYVDFYAAMVRRRFADQALNDSNERVAARGTSKVAERLLAAVDLGLVKTGKVLSVPTFVTAVWLLNLGGKNESDGCIDLKDADAPKLSDLHTEVLSWAGSAEPQPQLLADIFARIGETARYTRLARLSRVPEFVRQLASAVLQISRLGLEKAAIALLDS